MPRQQKHLLLEFIGFRCLLVVYCTMLHMNTILNLNIAINGTVMMLMILITMDNTIQHWAGIELDRVQ